VFIPSGFLYGGEEIMNKKKMILLGVSIGLLNIFLLIVTAAVCLVLIFAAVIHFTSPKPVTPEDDLARMMCEEICDGLEYTGLKVYDESSVRDYSFDVYTKNADDVHGFIDKINEYISGTDEKIEICFNEDMNGSWGPVITLRNYSVTSVDDVSYDGLYSLSIYFDALYKWPDLDMYTGLKNILPWRLARSIRKQMIPAR